MSLKSTLFKEKEKVEVINSITNNYFHQPVMLNEVLEGLKCSNNKVYVDCTLGGGGHSFEIAKLIAPDGTLISLDIDEDAIKEAKTKLSSFNNKYIINSSYTNLSDIINNLNIGTVNGGILADLGASSHQLTSKVRGFSFKEDSPLDMRMGKSLITTASDLINTLSEEELSTIFKNYGEERYSKRIAHLIANKRSNQKIETTFQLANIVKEAIPNSAYSKIHPATRVFQALRIAVNNELNNIETLLKSILDITTPGARIAIITFHSLEDRIVKNFFKYWSSNCVCSHHLIECRCNHIKKLNLVNKKPILPTENEIKSNPSARSAKLRVAERV